MVGPVGWPITPTSGDCDSTGRAERVCFVEILHFARFFRVFPHEAAPLRIPPQLRSESAGVSGVNPISFWP